MTTDDAITILAENLMETLTNRINIIGNAIYIGHRDSLYTKDAHTKITVTKLTELSIFTVSIIDTNNDGNQRTVLLGGNSDNRSLFFIGNKDGNSTDVTYRRSTIPRRSRRLRL